MIAPIEAVEKKDAKSFVRVKTGDQYETREVKTGASDNLHVVLLQGVHDGDELVIAPALTLASN